jgi:hypothetical protein
MNIKPVKASITFTYSPEEYLAFCEESEETPTQDGFEVFIRDDIYENTNIVSNISIELIEE